MFKEMFHLTRANKAEKILESGLKINQPYYLTEVGAIFNLCYGLNPIFLSTKKDERFLNYLELSPIL